MHKQTAIAVIYNTHVSHAYLWKVYVKDLCLLSGCKMNNISVVYTPWANLKKTGDMDVGQIGFHRQKEVRKPHLN